MHFCGMRLLLYDRTNTFRLRVLLLRYAMTTLLLTSIVVKGTRDNLCVRMGGSVSAPDVTLSKDRTFLITGANTGI